MMDLRNNTQRLWDLTRHQRGQLYDEGLLSDDEFAALASDHAAVARLETYDSMRAEITRLKCELALRTA